MFQSLWGFKVIGQGMVSPRLAHLPCRVAGLFARAGRKPGMDTDAIFRKMGLNCIILVLALVSATSSVEAACGSNVLGVSRTVEIDTAGGPKYGLQQYKQHDFLKSKEIVLTFDDGPAPVYTKPILQALKAHCTKATFFMVGEMARAYPWMVRKVASEGHTVGTHTWSHPNLAARSKKRGIREIEMAVSAVSRALGRPAAPFFRFPYLSDPKRMIRYLQGRNIGIFSIDVDSKDYLTRSGARVMKKVLRDLKRQGKGIILFHDIHKSTARALPDLLDELHRRGYKVVHLVSSKKGVTSQDYDERVARLFERKAGRTHDHEHDAADDVRMREVVRKDSGKRRRRARRLRVSRKPRIRRTAKRSYRKTTKTAHPALSWSEKFLQGS